ncbi:MAG: signal peptide peptidase SppA [Proteobacteria bacterium]|nr:signal peptide peptidase SppA [Pseudomonadota bacterium]
MFIRRHPFIFSFLIVIIVTISLFAAVVFFMISGKGSAFEFGDRVGVVELKGIITDARPTVKQLKEFRKDESVKAIVLRIDSPGGAVAPSQEIYDEVARTVPLKKVVVSMGSVAASGGYYIAAAADHIMANPGTITGSIGVVMEFPNIEDLVKKIGFNTEVIKSGSYKDIGSPLRKMSSSERELLQGVIDSVYHQFVNAVAHSRQIPVEKVTAIADGRIFSGEQAKEIGLVDSLGGLEDAVAMAAKAGGIKGDPVVIYPKKKRFSLLEFLLGRSVEELINTVSGIPFWWLNSSLK